MNNNLFLIGIGVFVLLAGCTFTTPQAQHVCEDGKTVVTKLSDCPIVDLEYLACQKESSTSDYGPSARDQCFYALAIERENVSLCRKVMYVSSYSDYTAANCAAQLAMYTDNPELCDALTITSKAACYEILANQLEDYTMCEKITSAIKRDECLSNYIFYSSSAIDDWSICEKFSESSSEKDSCYDTAASETSDTKYCDKIKGASGYFLGYSKVSCYASVAAAQADPEICASLNTTADKDSCYYSYATAYPYDIDTCQKVSDKGDRERCIRYTNTSYYD